MRNGERARTVTTESRLPATLARALWHGLVALIPAAAILLPNNFPFEPAAGAQRMIVVPAIPVPQFRLSWGGVGVSFLNTFLVASFVAGVLAAVYELLALTGRLPTAARRIWTWCMLFFTLCIGVGVPILSAQYHGTFIWSWWR